MSPTWLAGTPAGRLAGPPVPGEVPVVPDRETARRWAEHELRDPVYHERPSLLDRIREWLSDLFQGADVALDPGAAALIVVGVLVVVLAVALFVAGPVRLRRRQQASAVVFEEDGRSAAELRRSADEHAAAGRWSEAVLDRFRGIVRSLEERALLDERPGRTAREAARDAAVRLPDLGTDLHGASRLFDDVCYGKATTGPQADAWLRGLDQRVAAARPVPAPGPTGAPPASGRTGTTDAGVRIGGDPR